MVEKERKNFSPVGYRLTGNRVYLHPRKDIYVLKSWTQRRCEFCNRFLSKFQRKYCTRCKDSRGDYLNHREAYLKRSRNWRKTHK